MKNFRTLIISTAILFFYQTGSAQTDSTAVKKETPAATKVDADKDKKATVKPYKDIITDKAVTDNGVIDVHKINDKYFFELPDNILNKEFLMVTRLTKSAAGMRSGTTGYAGDQIGQKVIRFEKGPKDKILLRFSVDFSED